MERVSYEDLLNAGAHFGHLKRKWHPKMAPYIFMERNDIHIIDLNKTQVLLEDATKAIKQIVKSGRKVLFIATKKQAKDIIETEAKSLRMPFVTERWLGGMLTNFGTVRKSVKKIVTYDKMEANGTLETINKRERLMINRKREKLQRVFGGIADLNRLPAAVFIVDVKREHIAVAEAQKLNVPIFAMVDTNSDPTVVDFPIPANDDASKSINLICGNIFQAVAEGLEERKAFKEKEAADRAAAEKAKAEAEADALEAKEAKGAKEAKEAAAE